MELLTEKTFEVEGTWLSCRTFLREKDGVIRAWVLGKRERTKWYGLFAQLIEEEVWIIPFEQEGMGDKGYFTLETGRPFSKFNYIEEQFDDDWEEVADVYCEVQK